MNELLNELNNLYESYREIYESMLTKDNVDIRHLEKAKGKMYGARDAWKLACSMKPIENEEEFWERMNELNKR